MRSLVIVFAMLAIASSTASAGKPKIAILGLAAIGDVDAKATQFAKELTESLRQRARVGTGPYELAPGSDKDLLELKLLGSCENETADCMAAIGKDLVADRLLFGKVEKRSTGYQVSLKLLDVGKKAFERSVSEIVLYADASGSGAFAKRIYAKVTGSLDGGTLIIKATVDRGTILLDGQMKATLTSGAAQINSLAEGRYKLRVEAEGYLAYEATVTVVAGESTTTTVEMKKR